MVSVIICTHNPRPDYWAKTIDALRRQTLPASEWELVVIDNASRPGAVDAASVKWHPLARVVDEPKLGLTSARLRGIAEAQGDLLVFVDDDNVLARDYLGAATMIAEAHPFIGAFGGVIAPQFEVHPPGWAEPFLPYLAIGTVSRPTWSNATVHNPCCPCGAGLCIRRAVATTYAYLASHDAERIALDRIGESLNAGGDTDMVLTACDQGLAVGLFPELQLQHLIAARRVGLDYLSNLLRGSYRSQAILAALRGDRSCIRRPGRGERLFHAYQRLRLPRERRALASAIEQGRREGVEIAAEILARRDPSNQATA